MKKIGDEIIFSLLLDGKGGSSVYNKNNIDNWTAKEGTIWIHLSLPENQSDNWVKNRSGVSSVFSKLLLDRRNRPRLYKENDKFYLSLRAINFNLGEDPDDMVFLYIYTEENRIITIRHKKILAIDSIKMSLENGEGPKDSSEFLLTVLSKVSTKIGKVVQNIDEQVDEIEELVIEKEDMSLRSELSNIRRQTINLRRFLAPQREVLKDLTTMEMSWFAPRKNSEIRELTEKYIRYLEEIDSIRDRAVITHEEINSIYSEKLNKTMYMLSIVSSIFLPLGFITGLLGINVGGIPGTDSPLAFFIVCIVLLGVGALELFLFKLKKWI